MACFADKPIQIVELGSLEDIAGIGRSLFRGMRELDKQGVGFILVRELSREGLGLAIWDRLLRAAEGYSIDSLQLLSPQLLASISR